MHHVGGNPSLNMQQMSPQIIWEVNDVCLLSTDQDPVPKCITLVRNVVDVVRGFVSYV